MSDDPELEELRKKTEAGSRVSKAAEQSPRERFKQTLKAEMRKVDEGETYPNICARDAHLTGVFRGLEESDGDEMEAVAKALHRQLHDGDEDPDLDLDRSELLRLCIRVALRSTNEGQSILDVAAEARGELAAEDY